MAGSEFLAMAEPSQEAPHAKLFFSDEEYLERVDLGERTVLFVEAPRNRAPSLPIPTKMFKIFERWTMANPRSPPSTAPSWWFGTKWKWMC